MKKLSVVLIGISTLLVSGIAQESGVKVVPPATTPAKKEEPKPRLSPQERSANEVERVGIQVRIKDVARFRGVRVNQLVGYGLIIGLEGTGDTRKTPFTSTLLANALKDFGTMVDPKDLNAMNVATVAITAELPPFSRPGSAIDVTVQSIGDAKSLQGGYLLQAPLYGASDKTRAIAVAQGAVSIGGFNLSSGGSSVQKNHVNVGRIPGGALIEARVETQTVFEGRLFLELDDPDLTNAQRMVDSLTKLYPELAAKALDGGSVELNLPTTDSPVAWMSKIESVMVPFDTIAEVVINERTGTIVMGANVRLGPAVVAHGALQLMIQSDPVISQPAPFSQGQTVVTEQTSVAAAEEQAQVGLVGPTATVADLAKIFQALKLSPRDMIAILQALREQGSLKARIKIQ